MEADLKMRERKRGKMSAVQRKAALATGIGFAAVGHRNRSRAERGGFERGQSVTFAVCRGDNFSRPVKERRWEETEK